MRTLIASSKFRFLLAIIVLIFLVPVMSCALFSAKGAKSVLDVTQLACVLVNDWVDDEAWIAKQCDIADDYLPEVRKIVAARKKAAAMKAQMSASASASTSAAPK